VGVVIQFVVTLAIACVILFLVVRRNRERDGNAPLRNEMAAEVTFGVSLHRASVLGTGGFGGTRGSWIPLRLPKRLTVGPDGFVVSAPQALREFVFTGRDSSIAVSRAPSRVVTRDWIVITPQGGGRQLAIASDKLPEVWQALAATGATLSPAADGLEPVGKFALGWRRVALGLGFVVVFAFLPALVDFIGRHLH
jgi:hypothetical protein